MKKNNYIIFLVVIFFSCQVKKQSNITSHIPKVTSYKTKNKLTANNLKEWFSKDIIDDTIPGISLKKAQNKLLKDKINEIVIVAVIDSEIAQNDTVFSNRLWKNLKENPNNSIDDDLNGYIDDIYGWNFLGNKEGDNIINANYEYVRILKGLNQELKNTNQIQNQNIDSFNLYNEVKKKFDDEYKKAQLKLKYAENIYKKYAAAKKALKSYFPTAIYDIKTLNRIDTINNSDLAKHVKEIRDVITYKETDQGLTNGYQNHLDILNKRLNINFNERKITGDDPNDINDIEYGNNTLSNNIDIYSHGTRVASTIISNTKATEIVLMPICISPYGDEHDKDITLAIRYAVDNGAKVINLSFGKEFSLHRDWVFDAFKYAEKNNVLIVSSAGNSGFNLSDNNNYYPNDNVDNGIEISNNFVLVGASTPYANENLMASYSNYGKYDVDFFAPGTEMKTYFPYNKIKDDGGTSLSASIVSKIAALIYSYYPNLKVSVIKEILLKSSIKYKFNVKLKQENGNYKLVPFCELSKSGGIVNAYNALLMAEKISKKSEVKNKEQP